MKTRTYRIEEQDLDDICERHGVDTCTGRCLAERITRPRIRGWAPFAVHEASVVAEAVRRAETR